MTTPLLFVHFRLNFVVTFIFESGHLVTFSWAFAIFVSCRMKILRKKWAFGQKKWAFGHFCEKKWAEK